MFALSGLFSRDFPKFRSVAAPRFRQVWRCSGRVQTHRARHSQSTIRDRHAIGPFTPKAAALFVATGIGLYFYFRREKQLLLERRQKEREECSIGRPSVGGPFDLISHLGNSFTEKDLIGRWNFVYFGFTHCPDICPAELDKIGDAVSTLEKRHGPIFQPILISVDPARDTLDRIARYLADFHPAFIGATAPSSHTTPTALTSDTSSQPPAPTPYAALKAACKAYRVYFSTPPEADPHGDYLVDHSIFIYLMNPRGEFVEAFGQAKTVGEIVERTETEIEGWTRDHGRKT